MDAPAGLSPLHGAADARSEGGAPRAPGATPREAARRAAGAMPIEGTASGVAPSGGAGRDAPVDHASADDIMHAGRAMPSQVEPTHNSTADRPAVAPVLAAGSGGHIQDAPASRDGPAPPGRLVLIGTGHVFRIDAAIRGAIHALRPDVVFVELDQGRLNALLHRERTGQSQARGGFVHSRLQRFQEDVAKLYGARVGNEMLAAVRASQDVGARLGLIDAPGEDTVKRALRSLTVREKLRAVGQVVGAGFKRLLPQRKDARAAMEAEIKRYEQDPAAALEELRQQYPTVWRVLIDERDERMAGAIQQGLTGARLGVAVLGDGHVPGVLSRLGGIDVEVYRLTDVRGGRLPVPEGVASGTSENVSFGFDVHVDAGTGTA